MRHPIKLPPNDLTRDERLYIREIQEYLRYLSFHDRNLLEINVDGIYGSLTRQAVRLFQRQFRMDESGVMDRITWDLLFSAYRAVLDSSFPPQPPLREEPGIGEDTSLNSGIDSNIGLDNRNVTMETQPNRVG